MHRRPQSEAGEMCGLLPLEYHSAVNLLLLTARPELKTNHRLVEAAGDLGFALTVVDTNSLSAIASAAGLCAIGNAALDSRPAVVLARIGNWRPESALAVLEALVADGAATPNPPSAIRVGRDHWSTIGVLASRGLPVPETVAGADPEALAEAAIERLGLPVVVKQRRSRMGVGVIRCTTRDHLDAVLDSLWRLGDEVIVQRWIPEGVTTIRVLVVRGAVVAAARFRATAGEWRSNAARSGAAEAYRPSAEESRLAVSAAEALGLGHCGVDLVVAGSGPMVLEVNPTPGFLRLEQATGVDVAREIVRGAVG
jgi:RimK family alpha-L-glutamate ligase